MILGVLSYLVQSSVQNFTATPPIVEVGGAVTLTCIIDIREDLILNLYSISGDKEKQEIVSRTISNTRRQMELHHMLSVTASTSSRYTCSLIKIKFRIKESPLDITIADRGMCVSACGVYMCLRCVVVVCLCSSSYPETS